MTDNGLGGGLGGMRVPLLGGNGYGADPWLTYAQPGGMPSYNFFPTGPAPQPVSPSAAVQQELTPPTDLLNSMNPPGDQGGHGGGGGNPAGGEGGNSPGGGAPAPSGGVAGSAPAPSSDNNDSAAPSSDGIGGKIGGALGSIAGGLLGGATLGPVGAIGGSKAGNVVGTKVGNVVGNFLGSIFGHGEAAPPDTSKTGNQVDGSRSQTAVDASHSDAEGTDANGNPSGGAASAAGGVDGGGAHGMGVGGSDASSAGPGPGPGSGPGSGQGGNGDTSTGGYANGGFASSAFRPQSPGGHASGSLSGRPFVNVAKGIRAYGLGFANGGLLQGHTEGRADAIPAQVPKGSYIMPADVVSAIGQGNTMSGGHKLDQWTKGFPKGGGYPQSFASGGGIGAPVPVRLSDGEYQVPPHVVTALGGGDPDKGAKVLDKHVHAVRQAAVKKLRGLPPPK